MRPKVRGLITQLVALTWQRERRHPPTKRVAVVVPLSTRSELLPDENISMRHLCHYLGKYDKFLVAPPSSKIVVDGFHHEKFPERFFGSSAAHNRLLGSINFYTRFSDYEFICFYHLDSLVFSDQLEEWCEAGCDYIGAPFIRCEDTPWVIESRVGNGGFALLRVESALKVLMRRYCDQPGHYFVDTFLRNASRVCWLMCVLETFCRCFPEVRSTRRLLDEWRLSESPVGLRNNDMFWSFCASQYVPQFKVATFEEGLRFAFEAAPRRCLELNMGRIPFGCHAWDRYDREFWEPHLLSECDDANGEEVPK